MHSFNHMPKEIYLGRIGIEDCEQVNFRPQKVQLIFSGGKFVCPSIFEESGNHY